MTPLTPVVRSGLFARGVELELAGKVIGSLPDGFARPVRSRAVAAPPSCPGYHISSTAGTESSQGMSTGWAVFRTTIVFGLTAATAAMSASAPGVKDATPPGSEGATPPELL